MKLPERIPRRLRDAALSLPEMQENEGAWPRERALEVIDSLAGTTVPVSDVVVFSPVPWGYAPADTSLTIDRITYEPDADYALRSRSMAAEFIRSFEGAVEEALFALTFPVWKDAA